MYYALKRECYYRKYDNIGYLYNSLLFTDVVVDLYGTIFLENIDYELKGLNDILEDAVKCFENVNVEDIRDDVIIFLDNLVKEGFLIVSNNPDSNLDETTFHGTIEKRMIRDFSESKTEQSSYLFLEKYFSEHPFLTAFNVELTNKCNERCVHCYIPHEEKNSEISTDLMFSVIDQCKEMGVLNIVFSGGEPMLHPYFCDFVRHAKDLDLNTVVLTNLTLLNEDITEVLLYRHPSCVNVSLYSMDSKIHDSITTVNGAFSRTKTNILNLLDKGIPVQINCPIMQGNKDSFENVITWGEEHRCAVNVDYLIMARSDKSTDNLRYRLCKNDLRRVIEKIIERDMVFRSNMKFLKNRGENNVNSERVCGVGLTTLSMNCKGDVYPCAGWQKYNCGNLNVTRLQSIWYDSPQVQYLRKLRMRDFKRCADCDSKEYCSMCMARNSNEDKDGDIFNIPKITCDAAKIHHKVVEEYWNGNT